MRHRGEGELLSVRRLRCVWNQAHLYGALFHLLGEIKLRAELLRDLRGERDDFVIAAGDVQVMNLSIVGVDDLLAARKKRVTGKEIAREAGLLVVARDGIFHPAVFARLEIAQAQSALGLIPRDVEKLV